MLFLLIVLPCGHAYEIDVIKSGDNLESIAKRNIHRVSIKYGKNYKDYAEDIKKWNPKITDWAHPSKDQQIYVDFPYDHYVSGSTWTPPLGLESSEGSDEFDQKLSLSIFYASSFGTYSENINDQSITSGQNFPVTLGLGFSSTNNEMKHFVVGSFYWAQASSGNVKDSSGTSDTSLSIPGEIGGNLYYQNYLREQKVALYGGYDFEKLNTFNTDQVIEGAAIGNVDNKIHYATLGLSKGFSLFDLNMNIKASFSKSIASSTSGPKALTGTKYIVFYTYKPQSRFSFNAFFKHHNLSGPTELSINRFGLMVGYSLF